MRSTNYKNMVMGFRLLTLMFSFILFSIYIPPINRINNALIIISLLIVNLIVILLYQDGLDKVKINILWGIEITGIFIILMLTGGLLSLYVWMLLNPMLVGNERSYKMIRIQHLILLGFVLILYRVTDFYLYPLELYSIHICFGMILIMMYSFINSLILSEQRESNLKLLDTQRYLEETSNVKDEVVSNLIESIELTERITFINDYDQVIDMLHEYLQLIMECVKSCSIEDFYELAPVLEQLGVDKKLVDQAIRVIDDNDVALYRINDYELLTLTLQYQDRRVVFGFWKEISSHGVDSISISYLKFVRRLHNVAVTNLNYVNLKSDLLIKEEQNRIAEEMHDNVNQQLFALSCQVYGLKLNADKEGLSESFMGTLDLIEDTLKTTNYDLKRIIYRMSLKKQDENFSLKEWRAYISKLSDLYSVKINDNIDSDLLYCNIETQNSVLRIINETVANAVKHGDASQIDMDISSENNNLTVVVQDNGLGISQFDLMKKNGGIGLSNMRRIAEVHGGEFSIEKVNPIGTVVMVTLNEVIAS